MNFTSIRDRLIALGYMVTCFDTAKEASEYLDSAIDGQTVGIGGSMTVKELKLYDKLEKHNTIFWHWAVPENDTPGEILKKAQTADVYISSVNALSENGEIINIDGTCNRVAGIMYGHKKVYLIAGYNKIAGDCEDALYRARNIAAPLNARRLNKKTPCAVKGDKCYDCKSPDRICRGLSVLWEKPSGAEYEVVLINEKLGY